MKPDAWRKRFQKAERDPLDDAIKELKEEAREEKPPEGYKLAGGPHGIYQNIVDIMATRQAPTVFNLSRLIIDDIKDRLMNAGYTVEVTDDNPASRHAEIRVTRVGR